MTHQRWDCSILNIQQSTSPLILFVIFLYLSLPSHLIPFHSFPHLGRPPLLSLSPPLFSSLFLNIYFDCFRYVNQYGADTVRVLTLHKNRGKGGAVKRV